MKNLCSKRKSEETMKEIKVNNYSLPQIYHDDDTQMQKARNLFQNKIHQFVQHCMLVGGYEADEANEGGEDYVSFMSAALESENEWFTQELFVSSEISSDKKQKKIPFSFNPKIDKALRVYTTEYSSLLFKCMLEAGYPLEEVDANYLNFRKLTIESERKRLYYIHQTLNVCQKKTESIAPIDEFLNKEVNALKKSQYFTTYQYLKNNETFLLKISNDIAYLQTNQNIDMVNEIEIASCVNHPGMRKSLKQVSFQNRNGILMNWIEGNTLNDCGKFQVDDFLIIAREIVFALVALHRSRIVHTNLTTEHVIVDLKHKRACIIGLRLASKLDGNDFLVNYIHDIQRDLKFISPEQSGWTNQRVDYRSDLYSLGITFYFMLTGRLPYETENSLLMMQSHLGKVPESPIVLDGSIPNAISAMVMKLLEKNADDRYQCAKGILYDLELMIAEYSNNKALNGIALAENDISPDFFLPQKLYGRESEYKFLLAAFHRASLGAFEMVGVTGTGGLGKTFLIENLNQPIAQRNGIFIRGKFNQSLINEPFSALIQAIEHFCAIVLMGDQDTISFFKTRIESAVRDEGKLLTDVICNLRCIIGEQPRVSSPTGKEAKNRFYYVFFRFISAICSSYHPVVLLLDNIQWADKDSMKLLKMLVNDKSVKYFLFTCTFREDELNDRTIFRNNQLITVSNLEFDDVNNIIADVMRRPRTYTFPLSAFVYEKTKGNSFFVMQVLLQLREKGLIDFSYEECAWKWNPTELESISMSDHIMPLLVKKIMKLNGPTINLLKVLSCVGSQFHRSLLELITGDVSVIQDAVTKGFILPLTSDEVNYRFSHDYMQQAVLSLIADDEKKAICLFVGKQIWDKSSSNERFENLFIVTNLLNSSIHLVTDSHEKKNLLQLNFLSGQKAKQSAAFQLASDYLKTAIHLFETNIWQEDYEFSLRLFNSTAEVAYCITNYTLMEQIIANIMRNGKSTIDKIDCYLLQIRAYCEQRLQNKGIESGLLALDCLGEKLLLTPITEIIHEIEDIKQELDELSFNVKSIPKVNDKYKLAALRILNELGLIFYLSMPKFLPVIATRMMQITLTHGLSIYTPNAFALFGAVLCIYFDEKKEIYRYRDVALVLLNESTDKRQVSIVYLTIYVLINHWFEHINLTIRPLEVAYKMGRESGINNPAFNAAISYCFNSFLVGYELTRLSEDMKKIRDELPARYIGFESCYATVEIFLGIQRKDTIFNDSCVQASKQKSTYNLMFILRAYYFHDYDSAARLIDESKALYKEFYVGACSYQFFVFYSGLVAISMAKKEERLHWLQIGNEHVSLLKIWSEIVPENFENKLTLLEAEMSAVVGNVDDAKKLFKKAIYLSNKHCYINEEALANERAGIFCIESNSSDSPSPYFTEALKIYGKWEAEAKVRHIKSLYTDYISDNLEVMNTDTVPSLNKIEVKNDVVSEVSDELDMLTL